MPLTDRFTMASTSLLLFHGRRIVHLKRDLGAHGKAMCDDGLFVDPFTVPTVQFNAPAAGEERLAVDLNGGLSSQLVTYAKHCVLITSLTKQLQDWQLLLIASVLSNLI